MTRPFDAPIGTKDGRGMPRWLDYVAVLEHYNAGNRIGQTAKRFGCSRVAVRQVLNLAKQDGRAVRTESARYCGRGHPMVQRSSGWACLTCRFTARAQRRTQAGIASCVTCRRQLTGADRTRSNTILADAECCNACGRRWDGVLQFPRRVWVVLKGLLQTVDADA